MDIPEWYYEAATCLRKALDDTTLEWVRTNLAANAETFWSREHMWFGRWVRNVLRMGGFTDDVYGNLDDHYVRIAEIATGGD